MLLQKDMEQKQPNKTIYLVFFICYIYMKPWLSLIGSFTSRQESIRSMNRNYYKTSTNWTPPSYRPQLCLGTNQKAKPALYRGILTLVCLSLCISIVIWCSLYHFVVGLCNKQHVKLFRWVLIVSDGSLFAGLTALVKMAGCHHSRQGGRATVCLQTTGRVRR